MYTKTKNEAADSIAIVGFINKTRNDARKPETVNKQLQ